MRGLGVRGLEGLGVRGLRVRGVWQVAGSPSCKTQQLHPSTAGAGAVWGSAGSSSQAHSAAAAAVCGISSPEG